MSTDMKLKRDISDLALAKFNELTASIQVANLAVAEKQAIATALAAKSTQVMGYLGQAQTTMETARANRTLVLQAQSSTDGLDRYLQQAKTKTDSTTRAAAELASALSNLVQQLVFACDIVCGVSANVNVIKTDKPITPNELVLHTGNAATDANDAIAKTLLALQGSFTAAATLEEARKSVGLGAGQSASLKQCVGDLSTQLVDTYDASEKRYKALSAASENIATQLQIAQSELAAAQTNLDSLKAGLAAANAAAYAK